MSALPRKRFSDAKSWKTLAKMMDEWTMRLTVGVDPTDILYLKGKTKALYPLKARYGGSVRAGTIIQALSDGSIRVADPANGRPGTGVCLEVLPLGYAVWAPEALMFLAFPAIDPPGLSELWLASLGKVTTTSPTSGLVQKVGLRLYYDTALEKHLCRISPEPSMGIAIV